MILLAQLLAGLGLLFIGMRLIGQHLRVAAGRRVRAALVRATVSRWSGLLSGMAAGAVTQSSNAVTLILANLMASRALSIGQAVPVAAGATVGSALIVLIATIDIRLVVFYMLALGGFALLFKLDQRVAWRDWIWAGLGLALLFLGLGYIKHAPTGLDASDWDALFTGLSPALGVLLGLAFAMVTQSALSIVILAVTAVHSGLLDLGATFWIMTGANLGSGLALLVSGSGLKGSGKRLCQAYIAVKLVGTLLVAVGWLAYLRWGTPAGQPAFALDSAARVLALLFLAQQAAGALAVVGWRDQVLALTARLTAVDPVEQASQPHYLYDRAIEDPLNAVSLAVLERERLVAALPGLVPDLDHRQADDPAARRHLWAGHQSVLNQTSQFLVALIGTGELGKELVTVLNEQLQLEYLDKLQDTLYEFSGLVDELQPMPPLLFNLSESLRTLVGLLADTAPQPGRPAADLLDVQTLVALTEDRGDLLDRLRRRLTPAVAQAAPLPVPAAQVQPLLAATSLFERAVWLVRRLAVARLAAMQGAETAQQA
ncbi:Na/Pi symporter [Orrella sp. JC864]|uniref:Na/Pi symporter n=1 Tax=Orrella sp. JC864 TaxID=3120298 RepID=UPI00300B6D81